MRNMRSVGKLQSSGADEAISLEPKLHKLLNYFIDHAEMVISRESLLADVWGGSGGSDESLTRAIAALRKTLQDSRLEPTYIATLPKKGYQWVAQVQFDSNPAPETDLAVASDSVQPDDSLFLKWQWQRRLRFQHTKALWLSSLVLILCSVAFIVLFNQMNQKASLPRYLTIQPLSAQDGSERQPLLDNLQSIVLYQQKGLQQTDWHWTVQHLASRQLARDSQGYQALSEALWMNAQDIVFRAQTQGQCHFWQQRIVPEFNQANALFPCQRFIRNGQAFSEKGLYWLDVAQDTGQPQLWFWPSSQPQLMMTFPGNWRSVSHLIIRKNTAYLLAQLGFNQSQLIELDLDSFIWRPLKSFNFAADQLSWWDDNELLINHDAERYAVLSLRTGNERVFGDLTINLTDISRVGNSLLAVHPKLAISDLYQVQFDGDQQPEFQLFAPSNRAEQLMLRHEENYFFVSERSGLAQLWSWSDGRLQQLTQFEQNVRISQLLWWQQKLVMVIDRRLWIWDENRDALTLLLPENQTGDHFEVCADTLYWTERDDRHWSLYQ